MPAVDVVVEREDCVNSGLDLVTDAEECDKHLEARGHLPAAAVVVRRHLLGSSEDGAAILMTP